MRSLLQFGFRLARPVAAHAPRIVKSVTKSMRARGTPRPTLARPAHTPQRTAAGNFLCPAESRGWRARTCTPLHRLHHGRDVDDQDEEIARPRCDQQRLGLYGEEKV